MTTTADPTAAIVKARAARDAADQRLTRAVAAARKRRATWEQIGAALGITKQGAYKRYGRGERT